MIADFIIDHMGWFILLTIGIVAGLLVWAFTTVNSEHNRLMAQCLADGKKEYECASMLKSNSSTVIPMPIIIPTR